MATINTNVINLYQVTETPRKADPLQYRLMQRPEFGSKSPEWFQDKRYHPKKQAEYIRKLSETTCDLNLLPIVADSINKLDGRIKERNNIARLSDSFAERKKKVQIERKKIVEKQNKFQSQSVGQLEIRSLTDSSNLTSSGSQSDRTSKKSKTAHGIKEELSHKPGKSRPISLFKLPYLSSMSESHINELHKSTPIIQSDFIKEVMHVQKKKVTENSPILPGQHISSIPNIGRRAFKNPSKLCFVDRHNEDDGYMTQISVFTSKQQSYRSTSILKHDMPQKSQAYRRADTQDSDISSGIKPAIRFHNGLREHSMTETTDAFSHSIAPCTTPELNLESEALVVGFEAERTLTSLYCQQLQNQHVNTHYPQPNFINNHCVNPEETECIFCQNPNLISNHMCRFSSKNTTANYKTPAPTKTPISVNGLPVDIHSAHYLNKVSSNRKKDRVKDITVAQDGILLNKIKTGTKQIVVDLSHIRNNDSD